MPIWEKFPLAFLRAHDAEEAMFRSYEVSSVNTIFFSFLLAIFYAHDWRLAMLTAIGVGLAVAFNPLTSYFTSTRRPPVKEIVKSTSTGPATTILSGLSVGMESSVWALVRHRHQLHQRLAALPRPGRDLCAVRGCHGRHRHAEPHRQQRGDGLVRPDLGQC